MFLAALFIANRLYARIGIVNALLLLPLTYLLGFVLFAAKFSLSTAVVARLAQVVVLSGVGDGAYSAFFNVVPSELRAQVRAFDAGVPTQIGTILSGLLLLLANGLLNTTAIFIIGMVVAVLCALVVWQMHRHYIEALLAALRAGRLDIFAEGYRTFAGLAQDREATRTLVAALSDPRPTTQRLAAGMLARIGATAAVPDLIRRLSETTGDARLSIIRALGQLADSRALKPVTALLGDDSIDVRAAALEALPALRTPDDVEIPRLVVPLLDAPDFPVRLQAANSLAKLGDAPAALHTLLGLLHDTVDEAGRIRVLQSFQPVLQAASMATPDTLKPVIQALQDPSPAVRRAACEGLTGVHAPAALKALAASLSDPAPLVRAGAAQALRLGGPSATPFVAACLKTAPDAGVVIEAFSADDPAIRAPLREFAQEIIERLRAWREASQALPRRGPATTFLVYLLETRAAQAEQLAVKIIGLLGNERAMRLVAKTLASGRAEARATAVEALDTLGDKTLVRTLLPLVEAAPTGESSDAGRGAPVDEIVRRLLVSDDPLVRAVTAKAAGELGLANQTAQPLGGAMETLSTLSLVDRTLLLREVPIFSDLAPDDLVQVAQVAQERWFTDGAVLCREGETGDELFVIATGEVRVTRQMEGATRVLATRQAGEFVGEMAIIDSVPRFATVSAQGETRALVIRAESFRAILRDCPDVALAVMRGLSRRLREQGG